MRRGGPTPSDELAELMQGEYTAATHVAEFGMDRMSLAMEGLKRCDPVKGCGQAKEISEFYTTGPGKTPKGICKDCDNARHRPPTDTKILRRRAVQRATARLIERHREEHDELIEIEMALAEQEAEVLRHLEPDNPMPRLRPGPKRAGQTVLHRIDTAECRRCHTHHDRGHRCPNCGHTEEE